MKTLKTNFKFMLNLLLIIGLLLTSCEPNDDSINSPNNNPDTSSESGLDQGESIQRDFIGKIVNNLDQPLSNVNVSIGSDTAITDNNGVFIINNATVNKNQAYIVSEKNGYLKGMHSVVPTQGTNAVNIMLIPENLTATITSGVDSEVALVNGTKVKFDGNFKDENGNAYTGNVNVYMYHLDPSNPNIEAIMPGNLQAENAQGEERVLETYGMLNVELKSASGEKLNIADGHVAEIEIPVDTAQTSVAPATIPLWHFDEVKGYWEEEGEATLIGGKYVGEVSHFSWWNCDAQFPTVTLCLNIVDNSNAPISNVKVELYRSGAVYPRVGFSDVNGEICGLIPENEVLTLKAYDQCGILVHTTTVGPFSINTNLGNVVLSSVVPTTITGNLVDCSSANVTNGYVELLYGNQYSFVNVTSGSFSFNVIQCASSPTFNLEGVDYNAFQTTTQLPFNFITPNVGNIIACNTITEYIAIQIDSNPVDYYLSDIEAQEDLALGGFTVSSQASTGDSLYIGGNSTALGTYTHTNTGSDFWIEDSNLNIDYNLPYAIQFTVTNYGPVGSYIDITINGNYTDNTGTPRTITGIVHVIRDL